MLIGDLPILLPVYLRVTPEGTGRALTPETQLVVEGFPRSGTTFATHAIRLAQPNPTAVTHHVHNVAILKKAVSEAVPTLVVVRQPVDALSSYLVWEPRARVKTTIWEWTHYHLGLSSLASQVVVVPFDQVRDDLASVVDRLNERYGTSFAPPPTTRSFRNEVDASIRSHHSRVHPNQAPGQGVPVPDQRRAASLERQRGRVEAPKHRERLEVAQQLYRSLTSSR